MASRDSAPGVHRLPSHVYAPHTVRGEVFAHEHGAADGHAHPGAEAFPRLDVRDLVGASLSDEALRELWQTRAVTLGLFLFALALPTERLFGEGPILVQATEHGHWVGGQLALQPFARLLAMVPGIGAERAWFLIAASCWAACYPVLTRMLRGLGTARVAASAAALLVLLSPIGFLVATLPGPASAALLGSTVLFARLLAPPENSAGGPRRTLTLWFGVSLLHPGLLLMLPAVLCRLLGQSRQAELSSKARRGIWSYAALFVVGVVVLLVIASFGRSEQSSGRGFGEQVGAGLLGSAGVGSPTSLLWCLVLGPMVGIGVLGLAELLRRPASDSESRTPAWVWLFLGTPPLVQLLGMRPSLEMAGWALGPALALGLTGWTARQFEGGRSRLIAVIIAAQVLLTVSFHWSMAAGDPNHSWTAMASQMLSPGDLVITRDQQHDYLLHHRFRVQTLNLRDPLGLDEIERADWWDDARQRVGVQQRAGERVWVDWKLDPSLGGTHGYAFQAELHELILLAPVHHLDAGTGGERTPLVVPEPSALEEF